MKATSLVWGSVIFFQDYLNREKGCGYVVSVGEGHFLRSGEDLETVFGYYFRKWKTDFVTVLKVEKMDYTRIRSRIRREGGEVDALILEQLPLLVDPSFIACRKGGKSLETIMLFVDVLSRQPKLRRNFAKKKGVVHLLCYLYSLNLVSVHFIGKQELREKIHLLLVEEEILHKISNEVAVSKPLFHRYTTILGSLESIDPRESPSLFTSPQGRFISNHKRETVQEALFTIYNPDFAVKSIN